VGSAKTGKVHMYSWKKWARYLSTFRMSLFGWTAWREGTRGYLTSSTPYLAKLKMRGGQTPPLFAPQYLCSPFFTNWG